MEAGAEKKIGLQVARLKAVREIRRKLVIKIVAMRCGGIPTIEQRLAWIGLSQTGGQGIA